MRTEKNIALEFNEFSKNYSNDMIACVPHYAQLIQSFAQYLPENFNAQSILDLGCGNGNVTVQLLPLFPKATYTLVDASNEMIGLCRTQFSDYDMIYENKYFKDFSFNKDRYDLIIAGLSLHHCDENEKQAIFKNIYNSLNKGGIFSFSDLMINKTNPDHPNLLERWKEFVTASFPDGEKWSWIMEHYEVFDKPTDFKTQIEWLRNAGFTDIQIPFREDYWLHIQAVK